MAWLASACHISDRPTAGGEAVAELSTATPFDGGTFAWPPGKKAAVSLTYDDALMSQLDNAVPALDRRHLRGTFFLTEIARTEADRWEALLGRGHELAGHTMRHPCDGAQSWVKKGSSLQDYDRARMEAELEESVAFLQLLGAKRGPYTFAYPCGSTWIGPAYESYAPLVRRHFLAARGTAPSLADPTMESFDNVPSVSGDKSADELIRMVQSAENDGVWLVLMFHGVGGDFMQVSLDAHQALLDYLAQHRDTIWTDTFLRVSSYVMGHRPPIAPADGG